MNPIRPDTVHTYTQIPSSSETQPASHSSSPPSSDLDLAPKIRIPTTPSTIRIPYMSHGLAAHFLAGRAAEGLSIGTERLEGFPQVDLLAYYTQIFANQAKICEVDKEPTVQRLIQEFQGALDFEQQIQTILHEKDPNDWSARAIAFSDCMRRKIASLKAHESLLILGGWTQAQQGASAHAMLYRITKTDDKTFAFEICNTGSGVEYHPGAILDSRALQIQKLSKGDLSLEQISNPLFWQTHYELRYAPAKEAPVISCVQVYRAFDLITDSFIETAGQETLQSKGLELRHPQSTENCAYESLLAYTKIHLEKPTSFKRSIYHQLKMGMQIQVLKEYFSYLEKEHLLDKPISHEEAVTRLSILNLVRSEISTVRRTLLRELKKRGEKLSKKEIETVQKHIDDCDDWSKKSWKAHSLCQEVLKAVSENPETLPIDTELSAPIVAIQEKIVTEKDILSTTEKDISSTKEISNYIKLLTKSNKKQHLNQLQTVTNLLKEYIFIPSLDLEQIPDVNDSFWDKIEDPASLLSSICKIFTRTASSYKCKPRIKTIICVMKLFAIACKLFKKTNIPGFSEAPLFSKIFIDSITRTDLTKIDIFMVSQPEELESFLSSKKYLESISCDIGVFDEWLNLKPFKNQNTYSKTFTPDSISKDFPLWIQQTEKFLNKHPSVLADINKELVSKGDFRSEKNIPKIAQCLEARSFKNPDLTVFFEFWDAAFIVAQTNNNSEIGWVGDNPKIQKEGMRFTITYSIPIVHDERQKKSLLSDLDIHTFEDSTKMNSTERIVTSVWETSPSEKELRQLESSNALDFLLQTIVSTDDPSLRLMNGLNFLSTHKNLLQKTIYRKFLFKMLFGNITSKNKQTIEHIKTDKILKKKLNSFLNGNLNFFLKKKDYDTATFLLSIINMLFKFEKKFNIDPSVVADLALPRDEELLPLMTDNYGYATLIQMLASSENVTDHPKLIGYLLEDIVKGGRNLRYSKNSWPFCDPSGLSKILEKFLTSLSVKDRDAFLSKHLLGLHQPVVWKYDSPYYAYHNYQFNTDACEFRILGSATHTYHWQFVVSDKSFEKFFPKNKKLFPLNVMLPHQQDRGYKGMFRDENGIEYLFDSSAKLVQLPGDSYAKPVFTYEVYRKQGDVFTSMVPIDSLVMGDAWSRLGVSNEWQAVVGKKRIDLCDPNGVVAFQYDKQEGLLRETSSRLIAMDMSNQTSIKNYKFFLKLDPKSQLWKPEKESTPSRLTCPTFGLTFQIKDDKIWGTGEWEGFIVSKEQHLPSLRGFEAKLVMHHEKLGTVVLLPEGEMTKPTNLRTPMDLTPHTDHRRKLFPLSVDKQGRIQAANREEELYVARLLYHLGRPKAAMRRLQRCDSSDTWNLAELRSLMTLVKAAESQKTLIDICIFLKGVLLLHTSQAPPNHPWQQPENMVEQEELTSIRDSLDRYNFQAKANLYRAFITHIPATSRLTKQEEHLLRSRYPLENTPQTFYYKEETDFMNPNSMGLHESDVSFIYKAQSTTTPNLDTQPLPLMAPFKELARYFWDFYAIATMPGNTPQKAKLASWLEILNSFNRPHWTESSLAKCRFAIFFLKLIQMDAKQQKKLPSQETIQKLGENEYLFIINFRDVLEQVNAISFAKPTRSPIAVISTAASAYQKLPGLRKQKLSKSSAKQIEHPLNSNVIIFKNIVKREKEEPLLPMTESLFSIEKNPVIPPVISIPEPLDPAGSFSYKGAFGTLQEHLRKYLKTQSETIHWTISPENLTLLQQELDGDTTKSGKIAALRESFLERKKNLLKKAREIGLKQENLSIRDLEESSHFEEPIRWTDLLFLFAKQDANAYRDKIPRISPEQAQELFEETAQSLFLQTRLQRLEKASTLIKELGKNDAIEKGDQLKLLLTETRNFPVDRYPAILLFEAVTEMQLRKDQIENLQKLADPNSDWLVEAIMGSGKSEVLIPLFAQTIADGKHLALAVIPKEQMLSAGNRLEKKLKQLFEKNSVQIHWQDISLKNLQSIAVRLREAIQNKEVVRLYVDELQHFFLQEQSVWHSYLKGNLAADKLLIEFLSIREILKTSGIALVDEVHLQLMRKRECQKPLGKKVEISPTFRSIAADLQLLLLQEPTIKKKFIFEFSRSPIFKEAIPFVSNLHQQDLVSLLSEAFAKHYCPRDAHKQKIVLDFLHAPQEKTISLDTSLFTNEEIHDLAFARGQIQFILPATLGKKHAQDYGLFPSLKRGETPSLLAGPYRGLDKPVIGSTFASPDEILAYTVQSYLIQGVSKELLEKQIQSLVGAANQEASTQQRTLEETIGYEEYLRLLGASHLDESQKRELLERFPFEETEFQKRDVQKLQEYIVSNSALHMYFLKRFILDKVTQYPTTTVANGLSFVHLFKAVKGVSATLHAAPTMHGRFKKQLRPEIEAEAFVSLTKNPAPPLLLPEKIEGIPLLEKLLTEQGGSFSCRALIDQGALIKASPLEIAKKILEFTEQFKPSIERVIYFDKDTLLCLERGKKEPVKYNPLKCPPETSFTFYDQTHATGTDIPQMKGATAWVTLHENTTYADLCQAGFRMRGLKTLDQSILFVSSYELSSTIKEYLKKDREMMDSIQAADLLRYSKHVQAKLAEEENVKAVLDKLRGLFLEQCQAQLDDLFLEKYGSKDLKDLVDPSIFEMMVRESSMNPIASYATSSHWMDPKNLFYAMRDQYLEKLKKYLPEPALSSLKLQMDLVIQEATDKDHPLVPDQVLSKSDVAEGREVEMLQEQQQEQNIEQEQQQQKDLTTIKMEFATTDSLLGQEVPLFDPNTLSLFSLKEQSQLSLLPSNSFSTIPPIYPISVLVRAGVSQKKDPLISDEEILKLADHLPKKLFFSLNATMATKDLPPFRKNQLLLDKVLLVPDPENPNEPYLIALSKKESELWYHAIANKKSLPEDLTGACLFSLEGDSFIHADIDGRIISQDPSFSLRSFRSAFHAEPTQFEVLTSKMKWFMGFTDMYSQKERQILVDWMEKLGIREMEKWFNSWFAVSYRPYISSILEDAIKSTKTALPLQKIIETTTPPPTSKQTLPANKQIKPSIIKRFFKGLFFPIFALGFLLARPLRWLFLKNKPKNRS